MSDRRRNLFILLLVSGLLIGSLVVIVTKPTKLGLDLKGGVELVYQGKPSAAQPKVTPEALDRAVEIMRQRVDQLGVSEPAIQRSGSDQITVDLPDVKNAGRAEKQVGTPAQLAFYDWEKDLIDPDTGKTVAQGEQTGTQSSQTLSQAAGAPAQGQSIYDAVKLASKQPVRKSARNSRLGTAYYLFGTGHKLIAGPSDNVRDLVSDLPGAKAPKGSELLKVPQGTVVLQATPPSGQSAITDPNKARWYVLRDDVSLFGKDIKDPQQGYTQLQNPDVEFKFTDEGKNAFHDVTRQIAQRGQSLGILGGGNQHFAVALDGKLISVAYIDYKRLPDGIDGDNGATIEGGFTLTEAQDLANLLKLGALPIGLKLISQSQVSATLGQEALNQGLVAGLVGFALVVLFLLAFYRVLGLIAVGALVIYGIYFFALVKLVPVTLTLPGIAGLILTIGVAADANIVIFERIKEEARAGRTIGAAIAAGYKKGLSAIIDANVVTLMTAFILFILATAGVKGFAFMLGVGTIVSLFTAVMATQAILGTLGHTRLLASKAALGVREAVKPFWSRFDFMGASRWFFSMSGLILVIGALAIGGKGLNFGIDFESGTRITTGIVDSSASENDVRSVLAAQGVPDATIQKISNKDLGSNAYQISTEQLQPQGVQDVKRALDDKFGSGDELGTRSFSSQSVGPTFGAAVADSAVIAIIVSLALISIYIALRFEWKFAVPVLIALMHDLMIVSGVYALTGREVTTSTVAALLTILGYSLYDTIIVFDRVRENIPRMPRAAFNQIVNRSLSEVMTRSLVTSGSTLLPILALLLFGGATLKDFAFALLVGVASGAYSSIFIATPVLQHWKEREPVYEARHRRIAAANGGVVPAYATTGGKLDDAEPEPKRRRFGRRGITTPDQPEQVSAEEFEELKRDLDVDDGRKAGAAAPSKRAGRSRAALAEREPEPRPAPEAPPPAPAAVDDEGFAHAPDEAENEGMSGPTERERKHAKTKRPRNRRHGRNR